MTHAIHAHTLARVAEVAGPLRRLSCKAELTAAARLNEDLQFDSLDRQSLAVELDHEFHIEIPDNDLADWQTLGDVTATIDRLLSERRTAA